MSTSLMYHTQGIRGFQHQSFDFQNKEIIQRIKCNSFHCEACLSSRVTVSRHRTRRIQGLPYGSERVYFELDVHWIYCLECQYRSLEQLPFLSHPKSRITKQLERSVIELRSEMSISAVAQYFSLDWRTVKNCEKRHLQKKFKRINLKNVKVIGIDEIFVTRRKDHEKYITVVRDLESGAVLHVGKGKGGDALEEFGVKLKRRGIKIEVIAMDMSKAFYAWVQKNIPDAEVVFDHFHIIKLMNDKLDKVRRRTATFIDGDQRQLLKNQRFLFLRNVENLEPDAKQLLDNLRKIFHELGETSMMKEALRSIYDIAKNDLQAEAAFKNWCDIANQTEVDELKQMAKTIQNNLNGITAYWRTNRLSNAAMEGFNNKIRWLMRQAYGYRDEEYFHLKIYDLPEIKTQKEI